MKHNYLKKKKTSTTGTFHNNEEVEISVHMQEPHFNRDRILKHVPTYDQCLIMLGSCVVK